MSRKVDFDIALSFAGEDRQYVDRVANLLRARGVTTFYDLFEEASLWGKNLYDYLSDVYQNKARFTVMFISAAYARKVWPTHERQAMQARAFQEATEYILPARFDDTEIPGILPTVGYISLIDRTPEVLVDVILKKLVHSGATIPSEQVRRNFSTIRTVPRVAPTELNVSVRTTSNEPISRAKVAALAANNTTLSSITDNKGAATIKLMTRQLYRLLIAHPDFPSAICEQVDPAESIEVVLPSSENIGSVIISSTGHIPGLNGRLNPILDTSLRTYLYADNIAINGGRQQPVGFTINEPFELEDSGGAVFIVTVKLISGRTSLLQYVKPTYSDAS